MNALKLFIVTLLLCSTTFAAEIYYTPQEISQDEVESLVTVFEKDLPEIIKNAGFSQKPGDESVILPYKNKEGRRILLGAFNNNTPYALIPLTLLGDSGGGTYTFEDTYYAVYASTKDGWKHRSDILLNHNSIAQLYSEDHSIDNTHDGYLDAHSNIIVELQGHNKLSRTETMLVTFHKHDLNNPFLVWMPESPTLPQAVSFNALDGKDNTIALRELFGQEIGNSKDFFRKNMYCSPIDGYVYHQYNNASFYQKDDQLILNYLLGIPDNFTLTFNEITINKNTTPAILVHDIQGKYVYDVVNANNEEARKNIGYSNSDFTEAQKETGGFYALNDIDYQDAVPHELPDNFSKTPQGDFLFNKQFPWYALGFDQWLASRGQPPSEANNPEALEAQAHFYTTTLTYTQSINVKFPEARLSPSATFYFYQDKFIAIRISYFDWASCGD